MSTKVILTIIVMVVFAPCSMAQEDDWKKYIPQLNLYLRSALEIPSGDDSDDFEPSDPQAQKRLPDDAKIRLNEARIEVMGNLNPDLSYRVRWRANGDHTSRDGDNTPQSLDFAMVSYRFGPSKEFKLNAGKQILFQGSWELEKNPTLEYQYSDYINFQQNIFTMAMKLDYSINDNHALYLQLYNTYDETFNERHSDFNYDKNGFNSADWPLGLLFAWRGKLFDDRLRTNWSYSISQFADGETNHSIGIGNKLLLPKFEWYLDLSYSHYPVDYPGIASEGFNALTGGNVFAQDTDYYTAVTRLDYNFLPKWFVTAKGIYERSKIDDEDFHRDHIAGLIGLEYKPFKKHMMKLFTYYYYNFQRLDLDGADDDFNQSILAFGVLYTGDVLQVFK